MINPLLDPYWPIWFLIIGLATWRVTSIVQLEAIFAPIRSRLGITDHEDPEKRVYPKTFIGGLMSCFWCVSVWIGLVWFAVWMIGAQLIAIPFALSMVAILIQEARYHTEKVRQRWCNEDEEHSRKTLINWLLALPTAELKRFHDLFEQRDVTRSATQKYIWHDPYSHLLPEVVRDRLIEPDWYTVIKLLIADEIRHREDRPTRISVHKFGGETVQAHR